MDFQLIQNETSTPQGTNPIQQEQQAKKQCQSKCKQVLNQIIASSQKNIKKSITLLDKFENNNQPLKLSPEDEQEFSKYSENFVQLLERGYTCESNLIVQALLKHKGDLEQSATFLNKKTQQQQENYEKQVRNLIVENQKYLEELFQLLPAKEEKKIVKNQEKENNQLKKQNCQKAEKLEKKSVKIEKKLNKVCENDEQLQQSLTERLQCIQQKQEKVQQKIAIKQEKQARKEQKQIEKQNLKDQKKKEEKLSKEDIEIQSNQCLKEISPQIQEIVICGPAFFTIDEIIKKLNQNGKGNTVGQSLMAEICQKALSVQYNTQLLFNKALYPTERYNFIVKSSKPEFEDVQQAMVGYAKKCSDLQKLNNILFVTNDGKTQAINPIKQTGATQIMTPLNFLNCLKAKIGGEEEFSNLIQQFKAQHLNEKGELKIVKNEKIQEYPIFENKETPQ